MNPETKKTEIETENALNCPPLPAELQWRVDQLMSRRNVLLEVEDGSDEAGELLVEAERILSDWQACCEHKSRSEKSALKPAVALSGALSPERSETVSPGSQPKVSALAEYQALRECERKGEVSAGSSFSFWRKNREKIQADNQTEDSAYEEYRTAGGALIRRLKK
jgi:hypothetical protein